ncbi:3402_t:CDS:2, partial [Diversispora eburnea]
VSGICKISVGYFTNRHINLQTIQNEKIRTREQIHEKLVSFTPEIQGSYAQRSKSLKELEDDYHKIYLSKNHLAEKYALTRHLTKDLEETTAKSNNFNDIIIEEETWRNNMQKLDWRLLNIPMTIQIMSEEWKNKAIENEENLLAKWYWQLRNYTLEIKSRRSNKVSPRYDIKFDYSLDRSTEMFREMMNIRETNLPEQQSQQNSYLSSSSLNKEDMINFVKEVIWKEMDDLF